jgi:hypothetical protein
LANGNTTIIKLRRLTSKFLDVDPNSTFLGSPVYFTVLHTPDPTHEFSAEGGWR